MKPPKRSSQGELPTCPQGLLGPLTDFLDVMRVEAGLARATITAYRSDLRALGVWLGERAVTDWSDLKADTIIEWLGDRRDGGAAESTVARGLVALRMLLRFLILEGALKRDPTARIQSPKLKRLLPTTLGPEEVERLLAAFTHDEADPQEAADDDAPEPAPFDWRAQRDTALLEVLYAAGARISEALGLRTADLPPDLRTLRLHGKGDKMRVVPLGTRARSALEAWLAKGRPPLARIRREDAVFLSKSGRPLGRTTAWKRVKEAASIAGLPTTVSPHDLRHSFASHMLAGGADLRAVQDMLGHASIRTTEIYTHLDVDHVRGVHQMHHPRG